MGRRNLDHLGERPGAAQFGGEIERRIAKAEKQNSESTGYGAPEAPVGIPDSFADHANLLFDLWAIAFQGNITKVVTFMLARELSTRTYPQIGVPDGHHPVSHHTNDPEKLAKLAKINAHHVSLFAYLVRTGVLAL